MAYANGQKSSAELEREVNEQRTRVEARIGEIKDRLSPGQLIDEMLSYTKDGGSKFASNLGQQITANPLPATLVGVGLAWLMASNMTGSNDQVASPEPRRDFEEYPYARVSSGGLKRVSHSADETGQWWSEFESDTGMRYKAKSDSLGRRAGHFTDATGKMFAGFIDDTGNRIKQFQDEAGNKLDDAMGWASHSWHDAQQGLGMAVHGVTSAASRAGAGLVTGTRQLGGTVQAQTDQLSRQITTLFEQQPLIAGALAFAAGAALGAALPHTAQEDQLIGRQADKVRRKAGERAEDLYEQGKEQVAEVYEDVSDKAAQVYTETKERVGLTDGPERTSGASSMSRH